ncbi:GNAT family N-acetyltransferase [Labrys monachus]|uniref:N-acetyltransferase YhbS n=1 Tax=Labrys monachus TaxID=217067 RepID=A0ABU0F9K1_9HYPH|nr:N-acetyltransferase [Labrys monachus]MDQ0390735.1 putative N-acetyltransferase YhbS [Labrys monachus]
MIRIVSETFSHLDAREKLLDAAFGPSRFAKTCERLREGRLPAAGLAFAAVDDGRLIGTLRLWNISAGPGRPALLLGPLAVDGARRSEGLGARMMWHALGHAQELGHKAVLLVGDAPYYSRFGFSTDLTERLWLPGPVERNRFLGMELAPDALVGAHGLVNATGDFVAAPDFAALVANVANDSALRFAA